MQIQQEGLDRGPASEEGEWVSGLVSLERLVWIQRDAADRKI